MFGFDFGKGRRGQGAFEYILMLAGLMLVVLLILVVLQGTQGGQQQQLQMNLCYQEILRSPSCRAANGSFMNVTLADNSTNNPGGAAGEAATDADAAAGLSSCNKVNSIYDWRCVDLPKELVPR